MLTNEPTFSIIIPTYRRKLQLENTLNGITDINYHKDKLEVVIVDDGGDEPLDNLIELFKDKLHITLLYQSNSGPASARNLGIQNARGRFVAFIDDDCIPEKEWLHNLECALKQTPDHLVGGKTVNICTKNIFSQCSQMIIDIIYHHYNKVPQNSRFFTSNNMAAHRKLFQQLGGFNKTFTTSEDRELCDRWFFLGYRLKFVANATIYHSHALSLWSFCRQHFNYGRGAWRFHNLRHSRRSGSISNELKFHANLSNWLIYPFQALPWRDAILTSVILLIWQLCNLAGFIFEMLNRKLTTLMPVEKSPST